MILALIPRSVSVNSSDNRLCLLRILRPLGSKALDFSSFDVNNQSYIAAPFANLTRHIAPFAAFTQYKV